MHKDICTPGQAEAVHRRAAHLGQHFTLGRAPSPYRIIDGETAIWVYAMAYGNGRLCIGRPQDVLGYDRGYCYRSVEAAFDAADAWDGVGEPAGWKKNLQTGEYRPEFE